MSGVSVDDLLGVVVALTSSVTDWCRLCTEGVELGRKLDHQTSTLGYCR